ncbi:hypothetical protein N7478_004511 [Penicillium angulare]|uniref:uncharacterized protein n=1 Tax=Penicillium angulare TaxID=116970 RepID=UPI0025422E62|nr:uncharacterized protein N7478_004511 [Penicillium angulare]KAJ5279139.1 hypothetical protein N7478_004511 [Penicillium angulare]
MGNPATQTIRVVKQADEATKSTDSASEDATQLPPPRRSFRSFIWDTDTHLKSPEEQRLLLKIDAAILTIGCLGFFMKYLDQGNITNAYVSGMQESLSMYGNQYTYAQTVYTVSYAVMQIPSTLIIQRIRPSIWLAAMEVGWATFTFAQAGMTNVSQLYAFRFLVGFFESSFFPVLLYLLGSWYTKTELAKRVALFHMTAPLGTAFSGYLQAAVYKNLDGAHGLAGWRWLYIICGIHHIQLGLGSLPVKRRTRHRKGTESWEGSACEDNIGHGQADIWLLEVLYGESCGASSYFAIWLKAEGFSVSDRNVIPTGTSLISGGCVVLWGFLSDYTGSRFAWVLIPLILTLLPNGILAAWPSSVPLKEFAFLTCNIQLMTAVFYSWANEICADNNEARAFTISSMNGFQYAVAAWLPILIFPQTMAPNFRYGFPTTFALVIAAIVGVIAIQLFVLRDRRKGKRSTPANEDESWTEA